MISMSVDIGGIDRFQLALRLLPQAMDEGAKNGVREALKLMRDDAREVAPKDTGELRKGIRPDSIITGNLSRKGEVKGTLRSKARNDKGFDYAYFHAAAFPKRTYDKPTTPGTSPYYLEKAFIENTANQRKYLNVIEQEILRELRGAGW
jgi:hypothetical protein